MQAVNAELPRFRPLIERQNTDQRIYDLEEWMGEPGFEAVDMEMRGYTTNHPQVYANKLKTIVKTSGLRVKIFTARETESQRRINQGKRDWTMAILKRADTWLSHYLELPLMDQMAHSLALRGWAAGRCLLRQDLNGETVVDVRPWDPRNVVWKLGPNGLLWICNRRYMTYSEIAATFPTTMRPLTRDEREDQQLLLVYDYLDSRYNTVFAEGLPIKMRRPHGADHVPAYISYVGDVTPTFAATMTTEQLDKVGESCYAAVRDLYSTLNLPDIERQAARGAEDQVRSRVRRQGQVQHASGQSVHRGRRRAHSRNRRECPGPSTAGPRRRVLQAAGLCSV